MLVNTYYYLTLILAILVGVKYHFIVVLIYISLVTTDPKHHFMCLLVISIHYLKKAYSCP
jgi:hypothetical protein